MVDMVDAKRMDPKLWRNQSEKASVAFDAVAAYSYTPQYTFTYTQDIEMEN